MKFNIFLFFLLLTTTFASVRYYNTGPIRISNITPLIPIPYVLKMNFDGSYQSSNFVDSGIYHLTGFATNGAPNTTYTETALFAKGSGCLTNSPQNPARCGAACIGDYTGLEFANSNFTIECWLYPTNYPGLNGNTILAKSDPVSSYAPFVLNWTGSESGVNSNKINLLLESTGGGGWDYSFLVITPPPPLNTWTHIAITRKGAGILVHTNGVYHSSNTITTAFSMWDNNRHITIGGTAYIDANVYTFRGFIDEVYITMTNRYDSINFTP